MRNKIKKIMLITTVILCLTSIKSFSGSVTEFPYDISTPHIYDYSSGAKSSYYLDMPTLAANGIFSQVTTTSINIPLTAWYIDSTSVIGNDGTTSPGITTVDGVPAIVWAKAEQAETYRITHSFKLPSNYSSSLYLRVWASESSETTHSRIEVETWRNADATAFSTTENEVGVMVIGTDGSTKNDVMTKQITLPATLSAGDWITIGLWPSVGSGNTEIKGVEVYYTPK